MAGAYLASEQRACVCYLQEELEPVLGGSSGEQPGFL